MKKYLIFIFIGIFVLILISVFIQDFVKFGKGIGLQKKSERLNSQTDRLKVGLVTGFGGLGDRSFNDMQYNGLIISKKLYGIDFEYFCPENFEDIKKQVQILIDDECDLIILGEGFIGQQIIDIFAPKYPKIKFVVLDNDCKRLYPNTASILFKQNESSFLAGFLAGKMTKKKEVGFIGGADIDVINDFLLGFEDGVKYADKECNITIDYINSYIKDFEKVWNSPKVAYEISRKMITKNGVDIIYSVAAGSNMGIFNAAKEFKIFAIGVGTNQDYIIPGRILTSSLKNPDQTIAFIIKKTLDGQFESKSYYLGLKENAVGLSPMLYTKDIIGKDILQKLYEVEQKIINKEIIVRSIFQKE